MRKVRIPIQDRRHHRGTMRKSPQRDDAQVCVCVHVSLRCVHLGFHSYPHGAVQLSSDAEKKKKIENRSYSYPHVQCSCRSRCGKEEKK